MESPIHRLLRQEQAWLIRRRLLMLVLTAALCFGIPAACFGVIDLLIPLREQIAALVIVGLAVVAVVVFLLRLLLIRSRLPKVRDVAIRIENDCPKMMDSLICATELLDKPERDLNPLNHALLRKVARDIQTEDIHQITISNELSIFSVIVLSLFCIAVLGTGHMMPIGVKARAHMLDMVNGTSTGILVAPGDIEVAAESTVRIEATIQRGPLDDIRIHVVDEQGTHEYKMSEEKDRFFVFELYGVTGDFSYQVFSPTVESRTGKVSVYQRPSIERIKILVRPPAYTKLPEQSFDELQDLVVPEGAELGLDLTGNMPMEARLLLKDKEPLGFAATSEHAYGCSVKIFNNTSMGIELEDAQGHRVKLDRQYHIEVIEDFAPVIQVTSPDKETSRHDKDHNVPILAEVTDDYGVGTVQLQMNINGTGWRAREIYTPAGENEVSKMVADVLKLDGIVEYGDVISYYLEAADQAKPTPHVGRCDIRFLEIHPTKTPPKKSKGSGEEKLSVADLILRLKHAMKETFSAEIIRDTEKRKERIRELSRRTADIHTEAKQRFEKIKESVQKKQAKKEQEKTKKGEPGADRPQMPKPGEKLAKGLGEMGEWFDDITRDLNRAQSLLDKELPREALDYHQGALSRFTRIQIELEKNASEGEGEGKGKGEKSKKSEKMAEENQEKERREQLEEIQQAMRKLDQLIDRQEALNQRMGRKQTNGEATELKYMENKQKDLAAETETLKRRLLEKASELQEGISDLSRATLQMDKSTSRLSSKQPTTARKHGAQASQFMERTRAQLEEHRNRLTGEKLDKAMAQLEQLREGQKQLGDATQKQAGQGGKPSRETAGKMAEQQKGIQQQFENLMNELDRVGEELEETMPEAVEKLSEALQQAGEGRIGPNMKRSSNALRYRQMKRAGEYQEEVRKALEAMSKKLKDVRENSKGLSPQELSKMLQETLRQREAAKKSGEASDEERKELLQAMKRDLEKMSAKLQSKQMQQLSQMMQGIGEPGAGTPIDPEAELLLSRAAQLLEKELFESMMRKKLKLGRIHGSQAPDMYRKLVDQYFKSLSDLEEE
ncbi:hypothetical protein BVY04_03655 [bacterium M21]|nr:hypothetical protein BVY04_03655 [bacterium M21]